MSGLGTGLGWESPVVGVFLALVGLCWGSFLNVCIYRWPLGRSVVVPGSRCYACGRGLRWWENLPALSWLWLRGRCGCGLVPLSGRYAVVELMTGGLFWALWMMYPPVLWGVYAVVVSGLIVAAGVDLDWFVIPDGISWGGMLLGLVGGALLPGLHGAQYWWQGFQSAVIGLLAGVVLLGGVLLAGRWVLRKEAMGVGDVWLLGAIGAVMGWEACVFAVGAGSVVGSVVGVAALARQRGGWMGRLPFGPFLAAGAIGWLLGGELGWQWYLEVVFGRR